MIPVAVRASEPGSGTVLVASRSGGAFSCGWSPFGGTNVLSLGGVVPESIASPGGSSPAGAGASTVPGAADVTLESVGLGADTSPGRAGGVAAGGVAPAVGVPGSDGAAWLGGEVKADV